MHVGKGPPYNETVGSSGDLQGAHGAGVGPAVSTLSVSQDVGAAGPWITWDDIISDY